MPKCAVLNCKNSSLAGFKMCHFPKDQERLNKWVEFVGRYQWTPSKFSAICEVSILIKNKYTYIFKSCFKNIFFLMILGNQIHFSQESWEPRIDGFKKLKGNAVPTILPGKKYIIKFNIYFILLFYN